MLTAIETEYQGYKFRSRTESRHGVFFDTLKIPYDYELEGYDLEGVWYLPDFWLPQHDCFIEVKGVEPEPDEIRKARLLSLKSGKRVFITVGSPWFDTPITAYMHGIRQDITHFSRWVWFVCPACEMPGLADLAHLAVDNALQSGFHNPGCKCVPKWIDHNHPMVAQAFKAARQARFEGVG